MKLLVVSHSCTNAIAQKFYAEVERQTGWHITIVTPSNWSDEYGNALVPKRWSSYKGQLKNFPVWASGNIPLHTYQAIFTNLLKGLEPDFIFVHQEPYAIAAFQIYLANQLSIRKPIGIYSWQNIFKKYPFPFNQMEKWVLRNSTVVFPGTQRIEEVMRQKGYKGRSVVLPFSIDITTYRSRPESKELRAKLQGRESEVLVGYVGRLVEEKGLKTLLLALKQIQDLPWRLVVVGSGSYEKEFSEIADELQLSDRINRLGYIPHAETPLYISALDFLVLPSETRPNWREQFGRIILEAMACGKPVVGSSSGEIPYLIKETEGGLIFQEGQPVSLANQLSQLILNPTLRSELAAKGKNSVLKRYTVELLAKRFIQAINWSVSVNAQTLDEAQRMSETYELLDDRSLNPPCMGDFERKID
jgi:glycosyltransferase involved in cell wall biosynthesis